MELKKILCPIDFSDSSRAALDYGLSLAKQLGGEVRLVHVYSNPAYVMPMEGYMGPTADLLSDLRKQLETQLQQWREEATQGGVQVDTELCEGVPYQRIVDIAKDWPADLIVIGTHGRTGLSHLLLGSVAERVVRLAGCPVLTVRHGDG